MKEKRLRCYSLLINNVNPSFDGLVKIEHVKKIECEKCGVNVAYQGNLCFSEITNCDQNNKNT